MWRKSKEANERDHKYKYNSNNNQWFANYNKRIADVNCNAKRRIQ